MISDHLLSFLKSLTVAIPLLIGLIRFTKIDKAYWPFIIYLMAGLITEIISYIFIQENQSNAVTSNIFILGEWLFIVWQYHSWGFLKNSKVKLFILTGVVLAIWVAENIIAGKINEFRPYFRLLYSFIIILISINIINHTIIHHYKNIFRNGRFLVCLGFIIFFIYKMVFEWVYALTSLEEYTGFKRIFISYFGNINVLVNIIFAIAILYFPSRETSDTE